MIIKITANLFTHDNTVQIFDTALPVNHLRTFEHPHKGEEIRTDLFLKAIQDAKDVGVLKKISFREVMRFYYLELEYFNEQTQYLRDFA